MHKHCWLFITAISTITWADDVNQDTLAQTSAKNRASQPVFGAELYSLDTVQFGKFVVRLKMVSEPGVVSSFFTYDNLSWEGDKWPWREIDFETIGRHPDILQTNLITGTVSSRVMSEQTTPIQNITHFHTYTLEWTSDRIAWLVDGKMMREDTAVESQQVRDMADSPQTYRSNIWISEVIDWVGTFREQSLPLYQIIDWIEYHQLTEKGDFELNWRDDFNTFDSHRWGKGNWTFDSNMVTFVPQNIDIIDGQLVMALTLGQKGINMEDFLSTR